MAQDFLSAQVILASALGMLRRELVLGRIITRMGADQFRGALNDTVNFKVPAILTGREYEWRTRTSPIIIDELEEVSVPVTLDNHVYSAVAVTDEELSLDITDFSVQVLQPQILAVAEKIESMIAAAIVAAPFAETAVPYTEIAAGNTAAFYKAAVDARRILNNAHVPASGRVILLGADVEAAALKEDAFRNNAESGGENSALRDAIIGRVAGFTVIGNVQSLPADFAIAMHPSAFGWVNMAPEVPAGVNFGASQTFENFSMRWIRDYDPNYLRDRSVVSSFMGASSVNDERDATGALTGDNARAVLFDFTAA